MEVSTVKEYMEKEVLEDIPELIPDKEPPTFSTAMEEWEEKGEPISEESESISEGEPIKIIRIGGFFGKAYKVKKVGDKIVYEKITKTSFKSQSEKKEVIPQERTVLTDSTTREKPNFLICPQCGRQNDSQQKICDNCGSKL